MTGQVDWRPLKALGGPLCKALGVPWRPLEAPCKALKAIGGPGRPPSCFFSKNQIVSEFFRFFKNKNRNFKKK
jgi:hypothetical protein